MADLSNRRVLITGVGAKPLRFVFRDITSGLPTHTAIHDAEQEFKANIGAATAMECARANAAVVLVARSQKNLDLIKTWIDHHLPGRQIDCILADLGKAEDVQRLVDNIPRDLPVDFVQSVGLGAGTVDLANDNPYLRIERLTEELIDGELSVLKSTIGLVQALLPMFLTQRETRVCVVSSMSAIRSVVSGSIHMAAKAAVSRFTNAAMLELDQRNIFVTDVRPGIIDTGLYDGEVIRSTVAGMGKCYGYDYSKTGLFCAPPSSVGRAIVEALTSLAHITSINMVARGQWPHEGS